MRIIGVASGRPGSSFHRLMEAAGRELSADTEFDTEAHPTFFRPLAEARADGLLMVTSGFSMLADELDRALSWVARATADGQETLPIGLICADARAYERVFRPERLRKVPI